jgi:hypothetical protein
MSLMIISAILAHWFNFRWARILCRVFCFIAIGTTFLDFINCPFAGQKFGNLKKKIKSRTLPQKRQ